MSREIVGCPNYWGVDKAFLSSKKKPRIMFNVLVYTWKALSPTVTCPACWKPFSREEESGAEVESEREVTAALRTSGPGVSRRFTLVVTRHLPWVVKYQPEDLH